MHMDIRTLPRHARTGVLAVGWRKARTGEDPDELYPIWPIRGGDGTDDQDDEDDDTGEDDAQDDDTDTGEDDQDDTDDDGAADLGDKGKQALDRMKAKLKAERDRRKAAETERDQLKTSKAGSDDKDADRIRSEAEKAATAKANARIVRSEVRAAAAGKLADPKDALKFLDLDQFEVDADGQIDEDEIADAIEQLVKDKPYLGVAGKPQRFQGTGDGGARKGSGGVKQLGKNDLKGMTAEQIEEARIKGQLRDYLNE
jgi:hypothetical protein